MFVISATKHFKIDPIYSSTYLVITQSYSLVMFVENLECLGRFIITINVYILKYCLLNIDIHLFVSSLIEDAF